MTKAMTWGGWILTGLVTAFLVLDGAMKVLRLPIVVSTTEGLGFPAGSVLGLGVATLVIAALCAVPRTAVLGAILMTAFLGGAVASHVRIGSPLVTHVLFGVYVGVMAWAGLWLRDPRLRALAPLRRL